MDIAKEKAFIIKTVYLILIIGLVVLFLKYGIPYLKPFLIGFIIAFIIKNPINKISEATGLSRSRVGIFFLAMVYIIAVSLLIFSGSSVVSLLFEKLRSIPERYAGDWMNIADSIFTSIDRIIPRENHEIEHAFNSLETSVYTMIRSASKGVLGNAAGFAGTIPIKIVNGFMVILSSFFFTMDYHRVISFVKDQLPERARVIVSGVLREVIDTLKNYGKAYGKIISITAIELSIGLLILRVKGAIWIAILIAIIDILPVLGTGTVMVPWIIFSLATGNYVRALGLIVIYVLISVIRQIIEPRIVGGQIGLHPIMTLMGMYLGVKLIGVLGLFLLPITFTVIKNLNEKGVIHLYNNPTPVEE